MPGYYIIVYSQDKNTETHSPVNVMQSIITKLLMVFTLKIKTLNPLPGKMQSIISKLLVLFTLKIKTLNPLPGILQSIIARFIYSIQPLFLTAGGPQPQVLMVKLHGSHDAPSTLL